MGEPRRSDGLCIRRSHRKNHQSPRIQTHFRFRGAEFGEAATHKQNKLLLTREGKKESANSIRGALRQVLKKEGNDRTPRGRSQGSPRAKVSVGGGRKTDGFSETRLKKTKVERRSLSRPKESPSSSLHDKEEFEK